MPTLTKVLAYAHDRSETRKQPVARARLEALWRSRTGALSTPGPSGALRRHPQFPESTAWRELVRQTFTGGLNRKLPAEYSFVLELGLAAQEDERPSLFADAGMVLLATPEGRLR